MAKNINSCLSHNTDDWRTPTKLYDYFINKLGCIDCFSYQSEVDEFSLNRGNDLRLYANPPFSKLNKIPEWVRVNLERNNIILLLMPARTDTKYFQELIKLNPIIYFIEGRLRFNDSKPAPFPTILLFFGSIKLRVYVGLDIKKWILE